jgi:hypothetical protein
MSLCTAMQCQHLTCHYVLQQRPTLKHIIKYCNKEPPCNMSLCTAKKITFNMSLCTATQSHLVKCYYVLQQSSTL